MTANSEQWNGTSWTEWNMNTARVYGAGIGGSGNLQTSGLSYGGQSSSQISNNEFWNGTSWTELADLSQTRQAIL